MRVVAIGSTGTETFTATGSTLRPSSGFPAASTGTGWEFWTRSRPASPNRTVA